MVIRKWSDYPCILVDVKILLVEDTDKLARLTVREALAYYRIMRLLLVEDNPRLGEATRHGLQLEGYAVDLVTDFDDGLAYAETEDYDLLIIDRRLPDGKDGLDICTELRKKGNIVPILMLTARGELSDKVAGLKNGADDYVVKPFELEELIARIEALTRRPHHYRPPTVDLGALKIDTAAKTVSKHGKPVKLTKQEYSLLECLINHKGEVVSKDKLIEHVWNFDADVLPSSIEVFVWRLRKKLDDPSKPSVIETVRGFGYKLRSP
jgi:two-component system, OmpR family, response regulator